jgi:hypothetical protein
MLTALLTTLTLSGAVSTAVAARWVVVHRRRRARAAELEALSDDPPVGSAAHLSPSLAHLAAQARVVRLMLATPLQRCEPPVLHETPWARRARCGQYDLALGDARRALWEWLLLFRRLGERDRHVLCGLGVSVAPFYGALFRPGVFDRSADPWEEGLYPEAPDLDRVFVALRRTMHDLRCFEVTLLSAVHDPYRR